MRIALLAALIAASGFLSLQAEPAPLWTAGFDDGVAPMAAVSVPAAGRRQIDADVAFRGAKSLLHVHSGEDQGNYVESMIPIPVVLKKDTTYTVSCWARNELVAGGGVRISVNTPTASFSSPRVTTAFDWTRLTCSFTPQTDLTGAHLRLVSWPAYGLVWFDEAALVEGPKPAEPSPGAPRDDRQPREVFVSVTRGLDSNDGLSMDKPFKTVRAATLWACPGSTITLLPGVYPGGIGLKAGLKGKPVTLRARRAGSVFIGATSPLSGFAKVPALEYTWSAPVDAAPAILAETDSGVTLRYLATIEDVEELAGSYAFDDKTMRLFIHPSDSAGVAHHTYQPVNPSVGLRMADYTVVDGLAFTGFGDAAVRAFKTTGSVVSNCVFHHNGYAVEFRGGRDAVIRNNEAWANCPLYDEGAQIYIGGDDGAENYLVENNYSHDSPRIGIRFYSGMAKDCITRGNIIQRCTYGFWYKLNRIQGKLIAERNVAFANPYTDLGAPVMLHNTYYYFGGEHSRRGDTDLVTKEFKADPGFADPEHNDFRLQSDSPARGKAPDGSDLGAFQYDDSVRFVRPDGDDAADGSSLAKAWKSLPFALKSLKAGHTLYLEPGRWPGPLSLDSLNASAAQPTRIRVRGRGRASVDSLAVRRCAHVEIDGLRVLPPSAGAVPRIAVADSQSVVLRRCVAAGGAGAGIEVARSNGVSIDHCAIAANALGLAVNASADVALTSTVLARNGAPGGSPQVLLTGDTPDFYAEHNCYVPTAGGPFFQRAGKDALPDLPAWRAASGLDTLSSEAAPAAFPALDQADFRVPTGTPLSFAGRYNRPVGPDGLAPADRIVRKPIERVEVLSVTAAAANITFWTPGRITGTIIQWGKTDKYDAIHDRANEIFGEYQTFHTVSLVALEPATLYHFRVGFRDFSVRPEDRVDGKFPVRWSDDCTFTTAARDPDPRALFVAPDGDDARDGLTPATAWRTLRKAAREARAGDVVTLAPGRYLEPLRPLQTGVSDARRITFRAERPLTVFLDGGMIKAVRDGRPFCIAVESKAWLTFENLACERNAEYDFGGYRGGIGYSGQISISGSAAIDVKTCVMDGRSRYMGNMWIFEGGKMPGVPAQHPTVTVTDSLLAVGWRAVGFEGVRPCVFRNCAFIRNMTAMFTDMGDDPRMVLRNCVIGSLLFNKPKNPLLRNPHRYDSDYNCFLWDPENTPRVIDKNSTGLAAWQANSKHDLHSIVADPGWPLSRKLGFGNKGEIDPAPFTVADLILPPDSPCRAKGENGEDIGPRWTPFLEKK